MSAMMTRWGAALDANAVLQEYPRPQMVRESYVNLNGYWDHAITDGGAPGAEYDGRILVPFSPEAPLSGVGRSLAPGQTLWYRRALPCARQAGLRTLLHFGAVDQTARVYVNGSLAADSQPSSMLGAAARICLSISCMALVIHGPGVGAWPCSRL